MRWSSTSARLIRRIGGSTALKFKRSPSNRAAGARTQPSQHLMGAIHNQWYSADRLPEPVPLVRLVVGRLHQVAGGVEGAPRKLPVDKQHRILFYPLLLSKG